jgi:hypothetical protein
VYVVSDVTGDGVEDLVHLHQGAVVLRNGASGVAVWSQSVPADGTRSIWSDIFLLNNLFFYLHFYVLVIFLICSILFKTNVTSGKSIAAKVAVAADAAVIHVVCVPEGQLESPRTFLFIYVIL